MLSTLTLVNWLAFVKAHPHDFTIQYPARREYFIQNFRCEPAPQTSKWLSDLNQLLLYLHIPFCEAKCYYCNFAVDVNRSEDFHRKYVDALLRELDSHANWLPSCEIAGVDIGGGTPTILATAELRRIARAVKPLLKKSAHPFPFSIETTPRIAAEEHEKLQVLHDEGVDRVSLGVQSFNAITLASVNRLRQIAQTDIAMANLRRTGFKRINLDIIFGLPNQTLEDWKYDLDQVIALDPDSITTYDCLYRGKGRALTKRTVILPTPETYGALYDLAFEKLYLAGWKTTYGSVNFSKHPNETGTSACFEGRLLDGMPYLGLGNYASSLRGNHWSFNTYSASDYMTNISTGSNPCAYFYELPAAESQAKYILYSLNYGFVDENRFMLRFGVKFTETFAEELDHAIKAGWMECWDNRWEVKLGQFKNMHAIRSLFYPEQARKWLMALQEPML